MINLLNETKYVITESGHDISDIMFIGSESGYECSWAEYKVLADEVYDAGWGAQHVANDLIIVFTDGSRLVREEYDGSERFEYQGLFSRPVDADKITSLFASEENVGWCSMDEINNPKAWE
jgi:hypothetical protein